MFQILEFTEARLATLTNRSEWEMSMPSLFDTLDEPEEQAA